MTMRDVIERDAGVSAALEVLVAEKGARPGLADGLAVFTAQLADAALQPDEAVKKRLENRFVAGLAERRAPNLIAADRARSGLRDALTRPLAAGAAGVAFCLLAFAAWPVLAATLPHVVPREVSAPPPAGRGMAPPPAVSPRTTPLSQLAEQAGFKVLVPSHVPEGCDLRESFFDSATQTASLIYTCMDIVQQASRGLVEPYVGEDSAHPVEVGGKPGIYVDGVWIRVPGANGTEEARIWDRSRGQMLIFEADGLVIRFSNRRGLTKEALVRVAESMRPSGRQ